MKLVHKLLLLSSSTLATGSENVDYIQVRNELNAEEESQANLMHSINDKLNDQEFLNIAIEAKENSEIRNQADVEVDADVDRNNKNKKKDSDSESDDSSSDSDSSVDDSKKVDVTMTEEQVECYMDRYPAVRNALTDKNGKPKKDQLKKAIKEFKKYGAKAGKTFECAARLSQNQIYAYLRANREKFEAMKNFQEKRDDWMIVEDYWMDTGYKEDTVPNDFTHCADEGGDCACNGTTYLGRKYKASSKYVRKHSEENTLITDGTDMIQWNFKKMETKSQAVCDEDHFGQLGYKKDVKLQCFCEAKTSANAPPVVYQADAPDFTRYWCPGNIFFGRRFDDEGKALKFHDMVQYDYVVETREEQITRKKADMEHQNFGYQCSAHYFGRDPAEGMQKACFCDAGETYGAGQIGWDRQWWAADAVQRETMKGQYQLMVDSWEAEADAAREEALHEANKQAIKDREAAKAQEIIDQLDADKQAAFQAEAAARQAANDAEIRDQNDRQERQNKIAQEKHEADLARLRAKKAEKALQHASKVDAAQLVLQAFEAKKLAHELKVAMTMQTKALEESLLKQKRNRKLAEEKIAADKARAEILALQAKDAAVAAAAAEKARLEAEAQKEYTMALNRAAEAKRTSALVDGAVASAIAESNKRQEEKEAREAAARKAEYEALEATNVAQRQANEAALAKEKEDAAALDKKLKEDHAALVAAQLKAEADEKQRLEEEARLKEEAALAKIEADNAERDRKEALQAAELATSEEERRIAKEKSDKAIAEVKAAQARKDALAAAKAKIEAQKEADIARTKAAQDEQDRAQKEQAAATARKARLEREAAALREKNRKIREAEEARAKKYAEDLEKKRIEHEKALAEAAAKQAAALKSADTAHQLAMVQAEAARKAQDERQTKDLADKLAARRLEFQGQFEHVWINGDTKVSIVQMTMSDGNLLDSLLEELFFDNMISDCEVIKNEVSRTFLRGGKEVIMDGEMQVIFTTADDRLDQLMKTIETKAPHSYLDILVTTPVTGNLKYIDYVNKQTMTRTEFKKTAEV